MWKPTNQPQTPTRPAEPERPTTSTPSAPTMTSTAQSSKNRALSPGNTLGKGVNDDARDNGHSLHEFLLRAAVAL